MCSHIRNGQVRIRLVRGEICNRRWTEFAAQSHDRLAQAALASLSRSLIICIQLCLKLRVFSFLSIDQFPGDEPDSGHADKGDDDGKKVEHVFTLVDQAWIDWRTKERVRNMRAHTSERAQESKRRQDRRE